MICSICIPKYIPFLIVIGLISGFDSSARTHSPHSVKDILIRVRMPEPVNYLQVRGFDLRIYQEKKGEPKLMISRDRKSEWNFKCQNGKIQVRASRSDSNEKTFEWGDPIRIESPTGFLYYNGQAYRNELRIYSVGNSCEVVNHVDLEKYLDGLVNSEFSSQWNPASIAAQVVAARTYAYYQILEKRNNKSSYFDVDASIKDQVYHGSTREDFHSSRAVESTRGIVLTIGTDLHPIPIKAFYHSTCGGKTELPENVWGGSFPGLKRSVTCPFCLDSPRFGWRLDLFSREVSQAILEGFKKEGLQPGWPQNALEILQSGSLLNLRVLSRNSNERVSQLGMTWSLGNHFFQLPLSGVLLRNWIGSSRMRSTSFEVTSASIAEAKKWTFSGKGNGHGVGMCQWGVKVMGEKGYKMPAILKYYYPDAQLRKLW